jgi:hypothetical protein
VIGNFKAGNGVIIDGGARILTTWSLITAKTNKVLVRNARGQLRTAVLEKQVADRPLAVLKLTQPYSNTVSLDSDRLGAAKDSRACFVLSYPVASNLEPAYPAMSAGVILRPDVGPTHLLQITVPTSNDQEGSPLFDATGHLIGLVSKDASLVGAGSFAAKIHRDEVAGEKVTEARKLPFPATDSVEALYEQLAPTVVQVVVLGE